MPGESGLDFIQYVVAEFPDTATVMITALDDPLIADHALQMGVYDYITKPFELNGVLISVANALRRRELEIDNRIYQKNLEMKVEERTAALLESEARLRAIFEAVKHVAFILVDHTEKNNLVLEFSSGAERLFGYSRDEAINKPATMLNLPEEIIHLLEAPNTLNEGEVGFTRELTMTHKSGGALPTLSTTYPIFNAKGAITAILIVAIDISERIKATRQVQKSMERWRKALEGIIQSMALTLEMRDPYTAGHQQRVASLVSAIAEEMGFSEERIEGVRTAAMIHDIGKISVPAEILSKPGVITEIEFSLIKTHSRMGYDILEGIEFPWPIAQMVFQHHERINGSGYPDGLPGKDIMMEAKILGVADVVEAMASHRPYRPSLGSDKALEEILKNRGILYDPEVVDACIKIFKKNNFRFD
jgi:PAS domain S-box-containing protein/putative nucleotidyltransferase with HDIG domain